MGPQTYTIPQGSYELFELEKVVNDRITPYKIEIRPNSTTHKVELKCSHDFSLSKNLTTILGFSAVSFQGNILYTSDLPVQIFPLSIIQIHANIARGAYINGKECHSIHAFFPNVPSGFHINETPKNLIYVPVSVNVLEKLVVRVVDETDNLINFNGESLTIRLHLKQMR